MPGGSAGAAGSFQGHPAAQAQPGVAYPPSQIPGGMQNPSYGQYYGQAPTGHTAAGAPPQPWGHPGVQGATPLGQGYTSPSPMPSTPQGQAPQAPRPQGAGQVQLSDDMILDGPAVPAELRGRTFGQIKRVYTALANDWVRRQQQQGRMSPGVQPGQTQAGFGSQQAQQAQQAPQVPQASQTQQGGFAGRQRFSQGYDPDGGFGDASQQQPQVDLQQQVQQAVQQALAPVSIAQVRQYVATQIPDFADLEGDIMEALSNASPDALMNPSIWESAADLVRGRRARMQRQQAPQASQGQGLGMPQFGIPQAGSAGGHPTLPQGLPSSPSLPGYAAAGYVPAMQHPGQFFTEGATSPSVTPSVGLSPLEQQIARQFNMSPQEYAEWKQASNSSQGAF